MKINHLVSYVLSGVGFKHLVKIIQIDQICSLKKAEGLAFQIIKNIKSQKWEKLNAFIVEPHARPNSKNKRSI